MHDLIAFEKDETIYILSIREKRAHLTVPTADYLVIICQ